MIDLLARLLIGVIVGATATIAVYSIISKDNLREKVKEELTKEDSSEDVFKRAMRAKVREVDRSGGVIKLDVLNSMDSCEGHMTLQADEIAEDITPGLVIRL